MYLTSLPTTDCQRQFSRKLLHRILVTKEEVKPLQISDNEQRFCAQIPPPPFPIPRNVHSVWSAPQVQTDLFPEKPLSTVQCSKNPRVRTYRFRVWQNRFSSVLWGTLLASQAKQVLHFYGVENSVIVWCVLPSVVKLLFYRINACSSSRRNQACVFPNPRNFSGAHFGCHDFLATSKTKTSFLGMKFCNQFCLSSWPHLEIVVEDQLFRMSAGSQFLKCLFGPEQFKQFSK